MLKSFLKSFFALLLLLSFANASNFNIDKSHSSVAFTIKHMMISNVNGTFDSYNGTVEYDEANKVFTKFMGDVETASISTGIEKRDDHLRSADFFDAEKYPSIKFVMTEYKKSGDDGAKMTGTLTIKDISKKVTFEVENNGMITDPWGNTRLGVSMEAKINRKDFGLNWNKLLESGGLVVGDTVKMKIDLELIKK